MGRVYDQPSLKTFCDEIRQSKRIVFTNGCFDILHVGHIRYLSAAKQLGDFLIIGLNSDKSVKALKGATRPVQCESDRAEILSALSSVDGVCIFSEDTPLKLIETLRPHVLVKGGDWKVKDIVGGEFVQSIGGQVRSLAFVEGRSTSSVLKRL